MEKPETLGLLRSLAGSCSEVPEGWCKGHGNCGACWNDALDMLEKELDADWTRKEDARTVGTVKIVPRIDWELVADEFAEFSETVRGMAGGRA